MKNMNRIMDLMMAGAGMRSHVTPTEAKLISRSLNGSKEN